MTKKRSKWDIIKIIHKKLGDDVDTSMMEEPSFEYINTKQKLPLICHKKDYRGIEHGLYYTDIDHINRGHKCPKCAKNRTLTFDEFVHKSNEIFNNKYTYTKETFNGSHGKTEIICPIHGPFMMTPHNHMNGKGCPRCIGRNISIDDFKQKVEKTCIHSWHVADDAVYISYDKPIKMICEKHGEFIDTPNHVLHNKGCKECGEETKHDKLALTMDDVRERARVIYGDKYTVTNELPYKNQLSKIKIICPKHGPFIKTALNFMHGQGCTECFSEKHKSKWEEEVCNFIKSFSIEVRTNNRSILANKYEIDGYIPSLKLGIECDGLYWHCEASGKAPIYHLDKTRECAKQGIRLIHIFEDEWKYKRGIVESMLRNLIGKTGRKIYARECVVKEVPTSEKDLFLDNNHIQGRVGSLKNYALYYRDELVSLMSFGKPRINMGGGHYENAWELSRFCNKLNTNVVGGASRLFKHFIEDNNPESIVTYADKRWSVGNMYFKLGFEHTGDSNPNYYYVIEGHRENRFKYRKSILVNEGYDKNKSEHQIMLERGIYRIYDCGTMVFQWRKEKGQPN